MGRPFEFNYDQALKRATELFWEKGYSNASLRDLLGVMKIGEGSFYHAFKSKKNLYLKSLEYYNNTVTRRRLEALESEPSVRKGIRKFFKAVLDELDNPRTPQVCLMAGSLASDVLGSADLQRYVVGEMNLFESRFVKRLAAAKRAGEFPRNFNVRVVAETLVTYVQGLFRVVRVLKDRRQMEQQIEALLSGLGLS